MLTITPTGYPAAASPYRRPASSGHRPPGDTVPVALAVSCMRQTTLRDGRADQSQVSMADLMAACRRYLENRRDFITFGT
jgi:hypothetical protein